MKPPIQVSLHIVYAWDDRWAIYVDGKLFSDGDGILRGTDILEALGGRWAPVWTEMHYGDHPDFEGGFPGLKSLLP